MTSDYLSLRVNVFTSRYQQILENAAYMVDAMVEQDVTPEDMQQWSTAFSQQYNGRSGSMV